MCNEINNNCSLFDFIRNNVVEDDYHFEALQLLEKYQSLCEQYGVHFEDVLDALLNSTISKHERVKQN